MGLKFEVHTEGLDGIADIIKSAANQTALTVAIQAEKDTRPFVPAQTLSMANRTRSTVNLEPLSKRSIKESTELRQKGEPLIIYPGPYARYLYYGKLMVDPETGSSWAKEGVKKVETDRDLVFSKAVNGQAQSHWFEASKAQNMKKWERVAQKAINEELKHQK